MSVQGTERGDHRIIKTAQEARRASAVAKPFISALGNWNKKAVHLRALSMSAYNTPQDRLFARLKAANLLVEVRHHQAQFKSAIKGEPAHSRLDDVETS